ncbi:MAG: hypothetical protein WCL39_06480, partial [Armatimonadota bacterium]
MEQQTDSVQQNHKTYWRDALLLIVLTLAVYYPSIRNGFVDFDDPRTILTNPLVTHFSWSSFVNIWADISAKPYAPPVFTAYSLIYTLWGADATAFHRINITLHALNAVLVYFIVLKLFKNRLPALVTGLLFALHPMHVDAVSWASALKDVLSGTFVFSCVLIYLRYTQTRKTYLLVVAVLLYLCALLSKPISALLPYLLLIVDYQQ